MTIYRVEERHRSPLWFVLAALLLVLVAGGIWWWRSTATSATESQANETVRALREAAQGLEVFVVEYPQSGQGAEGAGALAVLERAHKAFQRAKPALAAQDAATAEAIEAEFQALRRLAEENSSPDQVVPRAERLRDQLLSLASSP